MFGLQMVLDEGPVWQVPNFTSVRKNLLQVIKERKLAEILRFVGVFAYAAGSVVCHQLPERSFYWGQWQFPVCSRCTGLYLSAAVGLAVWTVVRRLRPLRIEPRLAITVLIAAALPTTVSLATAAIGLWDASNAGRALLAVPLGAAAGVLVTAVAAKDLR